MERQDIKAYKNIWVYAEQRQGKLTPVVIELLGEGKKLAAVKGIKLNAILLGHKVDNLVDELAAYAAETVYYADDALLENYTTEGYTKVIVDAIKEIKPEIMLVGATHIGRDLAPRIASRLDTGLTADCTQLEIDEEDGKIMQTRPAFGGNIMATIICPNNRPQMSTVRPGVMDKAVRDDSKKAELVKLDVKLAASDIRTKVLEIVKSAEEKVSLTDANIIVTGGKGLGTPEGFKTIEALADKIEQKLAQKNYAYRKVYLKKYNVSFLTKKIKTLYE